MENQDQVIVKRGSVIDTGGQLRLPGELVPASLFGGALRQLLDQGVLSLEAKPVPALDLREQDALPPLPLSDEENAIEDVKLLKDGGRALSDAETLRKIEEIRKAQEAKQD